MTIFRTADPGDSHWLNLRMEFWPRDEASHRCEMVQVIERGGLALIATAEQDCAVGFAELSVRRDYVPGVTSSPVAYLEGWFVRADWRGSGAGRLLIEEAVRWAREQGYGALASDAECANEAGQSAHLATGFQEVSRTVSYILRLSDDSMRK